MGVVTIETHTYTVIFFRLFIRWSKRTKISTFTVYIIYMYKLKNAINIRSPVKVLKCLFQTFRQLYMQYNATHNLYERPRRFYMYSVHIFLATGAFTVHVYVKVKIVLTLFYPRFVQAEVSHLKGACSVNWVNQSLCSVLHTGLLTTHVIPGDQTGRCTIGTRPHWLK